jgi:hypothetical protein
VQRLIAYVEMLQERFNSGQHRITEPKEIETVTLFYSRLFLTVRDTMKDKMGWMGPSSPHVDSNPTRPPPQPYAPRSPATKVPIQPPPAPTPPSGIPMSGPPTPQAPPRVAKQTRAAAAQMAHEHPQVAASPPVQPATPSAPPPKPIQSPEDFLKALFTNVRADCAVFYSTPHPPHF